MAITGSMRMKLFLDRNKTLLPRVDVIYLLSRIMTFCGMAWFTWFGDYPRTESNVLYTALGTFAVLLIIFWAATRNRFDIKLAYLSTILYDLILIPALILYAGGLSSSFYLLYFLTVSVAAYVLSFWFATAVAVIAVTSLIAVSWSGMTYDTMFDVSMRCGFVLVYYLAISYASDHLRRSERRLLGLFDTLNLRTSELEKSQAQLEMIYENSRILASILDTDSVAKEVIRIMANILQYPQYSMIFKNNRGEFYYRVHSEQGHTSFHPKAIDIDKVELVRKVCEVGESVRIRDISGRDDYCPLSEKARSVMIVPMISHGRINGVLTAESGRVDQFGERDVQMLSIVARSAALALENAELHNKTEELTVIDELTETYNYRYFIKKLEEENRRVQRYGHQLSIIMVDIDWFKKLNDSYGHEAGNLVLKRLSDFIKICIRDVDIFCRYGGEEFVVILPQTGQKEALQIAERIRSRVEHGDISIDVKQSVRITVSVGVSSFPDNGASQEDLVSIADKALYQAKGEGRNLVCVM